MDWAKADTAFTDSIAQVYERDLVPLIFEPYARELGERVLARGPGCVLELAAGTGVVTRQLARRLAAGTALLATDLNPAMLDVARATGTARPVDWQVADAMCLPFEDARFDLVVCQFGAMFFPDKSAAFAEARRVLRPGGSFIFNVWDRLETNAIPALVIASLATRFPDDPPRFLARVPHGYHDATTIASDVRAAGLQPRSIDTVIEVSRAASARVAARAFCQGTVLRSEILARAPQGLEETTDWVERDIRRVHGDGPVEGPIQALVVTATRPG